MEEVQVTDRSGKSFHVRQVNGRLYPRFPLDAMENALKFKTRVDDMFLCAFPKSGTHWVSQILSYLLAGSAADLPVLEKQQGFLESRSPDELDAMQPPRNLSTHFHLDAMPKDYFRHKCRTIYVVRDPRDVAVSYYHHFQTMKGFYDGSWDDFFALFLEEKMPYDSWFMHTKEWEKWIEDNPSHPTLTMTYEGLKKDPLNEVTRLAQFAGVACSQQLLEDIVAKTDITYMKQKRSQPTATTNGSLYRKGQVGDWKNWFTASQTQEFHQAFEQRMADTRAYALYSSTSQ